LVQKYGGKLRYVITRQELLPAKKNVPNFLKKNIRVKYFHEDENAPNYYETT